MEELRQCVFYDASDREQACKPYRTRLRNGNEIYCPTCRANKHYWLNGKRSSTDLRAYGYRLRKRSARMTEWVGGAREKVVTVMTREMRVGRSRHG